MLKLTSGAGNVGWTGLLRRWRMPLATALGVFFWVMGAAAFAEVIRGIEVKGNQALDEDTIKSLLLSKEGQEYSPDRVIEDIHALYASGFIQDAQVEKRYSQSMLLPGVVLTYIIKEKPLIHEVKHEGTKGLNEDDLKNIITVKPRSVYDPAKLRDIREKLLEEYAKKGYFMARVDVLVEEAGPNQVDVTFKVEEGKKPTVKEIRFFGNTEMTDRKLRQHMSTRQEGIFTARKYSQEDFQRDLYVLDFYYDDNGYLEAGLAQPEKEITEDRERIILGIGIEEGPQYRTGGIKVAGDLLLPEEELKKGFLLKSGEIFRKSLLIRDQQYLLDLYGTEGYALCEAEPEFNLKREEKIVDLTWHIRKGSKVYIEKIEVKGNEKTYDKVVRRELLLKEGQLFSTADARGSEARVKQLGYFSDVQIIPRPGSSPDRINLDVAVKEKQSGSFTAGAGVSTASEYFISLQYQQQNFLGQGIDLSVSALLSDKTQTGTLRYADPYFLDSNWYLGVDLFSQEIYQVKFVDRRQGGDVTLGRRIPHLDNMRFYATYSYIVTNLESYSSSATIYRKQPSNTSIGSLTLTLDNNALNNYLDPSDGSRLTGTVEMAGYNLFGGSNDFIKTSLEGYYFTPIYAKTYFGFHARLRWMSYNQGDSLLISERYFQGGSRSLRGYEVASVSPMFREDNGDLTPIGGNKDALFTFEYIVPVSEEMGMKAVFFYDAGNVYNDNEDMDFNYLLKDWGFGLRWLSPMGPLRFELAFPIDPRKDDKTQQFVFAVGSFL
jgi:outer membrane protein insertion porin family